MTECCLFVPCRPRTYARLVQDLYPKSASGFDINIGPPNKLGRLCSYAAAYPQKIPDLCGALLKNAESQLRVRQIGFLRITVESFRKLVETGVQHKFMYLLEAPMHRLLLMCFADRDSTVLALGASVFFVYTQLHDRCDVGPYMRPILGICLRSMLGSKNSFAAPTHVVKGSKKEMADDKINNPIVSGPFGVWSLLAGLGAAEASSSAPSSSESADAAKSLASTGSTLLPSIGLELLLRAIEILLSHPGDLEKYCADILPIVYYFYSSQKVFFVDAIPGFGAPPSGAGTNPPGSGGGSFWAPRSPVVISTLCLVALGSTSSPATASHVVACLMAWLDENKWEPLLPAVKAFRLIGSCSSSVNNYVLPLGSMLLSHARSIVNNPMDWNKAADAMGHSAVLYERKSLTPLGSEVAIRSTELRSRVIINVLVCIDELFKNEYTSQGGARSRKGQDLRTSGTYTGFNRMLRSHDVENIAEILIFAGLNFGGSTLPWQLLVESVAPELFVDELTFSRAFFNGFGAEIEEPSGSESGKASCALEMQTLCMKCVVHIVSNSILLLSDFDGFSVAAVISKAILGLRMRFSYLVEGSVLERGLRLSLLQAVFISLAAANSVYFRLKPLKETAPQIPTLCALYLLGNLKRNDPLLLVEGLLKEKDVLSYLVLLCMHSDWGTHFAALHTLHSLFVSSISLTKNAESSIIDTHDIFASKGAYFDWTKSLDTSHALLSSIYKIIYRCLTVYSGPSHSETIALLWQIHVLIIKSYGAQELYFGLPLMTALHGVFTSSQLPDLGPIPVEENRLAFETIEFHSAQVLYFIAYLHHISNVLNATDLDIILMRLCHECNKVFPRYPDVPSLAAASHRRGALGPLHVPSSGRRLCLLEAHLSLIAPSAPSKSDGGFSEPYGYTSTRDSMSLQTLSDAFNFLNHGIDLEAIKDNLSSAIDAAFSDSFHCIKPLQGPGMQISKFKSITNKFKAEIFSRFNVPNDFSQPFFRVASEGDAECVRDLIELCERRAHAQDSRVSFEESGYLSKPIDTTEVDVQVAANMFRPVSILPSRFALDALRTSLSCVVDGGLVDASFSFGLVDESRNGKPGTFLRKAGGSPVQHAIKVGSFDGDDKDEYFSVASSDSRSNKRLSTREARSMK